MFTAVTALPPREARAAPGSELPHITNCGVPFMKSATGSFSMTFLIVS
jgi:hypothetical protein